VSCTGYVLIKLFALLRIQCFLSRFFAQQERHTILILLGEGKFSRIERPAASGFKSGIIGN